VISAYIHAFPISLFTLPPPPPTHTLSLHDALPISRGDARGHGREARLLLPEECGHGSADAHGEHCALRVRHRPSTRLPRRASHRSEEHTSELQSRFDLVCRLLLEKKKKKKQQHNNS